MDNHQLPGEPDTGLGYACISVLGMILGWISIHSVYEVLQLFATTVSIGAGLMAIRHYYLQNKRKK
jgi:hypothetical protein